jgi:hypothetical protein
MMLIVDVQADGFTRASAERGRAMSVDRIEADLTGSRLTSLLNSMVT